MTKLEKMTRKLNDDFREKLAEAVRKKFGIDVQCVFNFESMRLVTRRADRVSFTPEQFQWIEAYSEGYGAALQIVQGAS